MTDQRKASTDFDWRGRLVLVTGAGGFIGSHLAERLVELGANVRALVHYNALGSRGWLDSSALASEMEIVAGDIADRESVRAAVEKADTIFHLAALIAIPYSYSAPASYVRTNVGTMNVVQTRGESSRGAYPHVDEQSTERRFEFPSMRITRCKVSAVFGDEDRRRQDRRAYYRSFGFRSLRFAHLTRSGLASRRAP